MASKKAKTTKKSTKKATAKKAPAKKSSKKAPAKKAPAKKAPAKKATAKKTTRKASAKPGSSERGSGAKWPAIAVAALGLGGAAYVVAQQGEPSDPENVEVRSVEVESGGVVIPDSLRVRVLEEHPHQENAFTQGLLVDGERIFESTGLHGESTLREVTLDGEVQRSIDIPRRFFAEGLAQVGDRLIQLTWRSNKAFVYRQDDFEKIGEFDYEGEGWGLCYDGESLAMSDGSPTIRFRDPETFEVRREITVTRAGRPQRNLNELECVDGDIYANIWMTNEIVRISPRTGAVTAVIDASGLLTASEARGADVLNGIAWHPARRRFLITGKHWPRLFEVEFVER